MKTVVSKPLSKAFLTWYLADFSLGFTQYKINPHAIT